LYYNYLLRNKNRFLLTTITILAAIYISDKSFVILQMTYKTVILSHNQSKFPNICNVTTQNQKCTKVI